MISIIVAKSSNNVIGKDNKLLWHIPEDLQHFKNKTIHKTVLMGRKTYESIGKPLPNRKNIVLTRNKSFNIDGAKIVESKKDLNLNNELFIINNDEMLRELLNTKHEIFIIGGQTLYERFIEYASTLYVTEVNIDIEGDTFFPEIPNNFTISSTEIKQDKESKYDYKFVEYIDIKNK